MEASDKLIQLAVFETVGSSMKQRPEENQEESNAESRECQSGPQVHSAASDPSQQRNSSDWQPLGHQDVAVAQENGGMWCDELSRSKFASRLISTRPNLSVGGLAIA